MEEPMKDRKITLDNNTQASRPSEITFQKWTWFRHHKAAVLTLVFLLALSIYLGVAVSRWYFVLFFFMVMIHEWYWLRAEEHFTADSNPGLMVSVSPPLFAVYTDLTKGVGHFPVIKVLPYRSQKPVSMHQRLATVAVYSDRGSRDLPHWDDFFPLPVNYATADVQSIKNELNRYDEVSWANLEMGLQQLPTTPKPGLYRLQSESSNWPP